MITLDKVWKTYAKETVFSDFSLTIQEGEFVAIIGKSGSGKTTLLNLIGFLEKPDKGEILIDGQPLKREREKLLYHRHKVGFLFQNFALIEEKTVLKNLQLAMSYRKDKEKHLKEIDLALQEVQLDPEIKYKKVFQLSGGEQQRVALARLLLKEAKYILADEPTGNLDAENRDVVFSILQKLNSHGKTIILVTHDNTLADRVMRKILL